jgi:hypothetical protein
MDCTVYNLLRETDSASASQILPIILANRIYITQFLSTRFLLNPQNLFCDIHFVLKWVTA